MVWLISLAWMGGCARPPAPVSMPGQGWYDGACHAALEGDVDGALVYLSHSIEAGEAPLAWMAEDPDLARVRADPRYVDVRDAALDRRLAASPPADATGWMEAAWVRTLQGRSAQREVEAAEAAGHVHAIFQHSVNARTPALDAMRARRAAYVAERRGTIVVENPDAFEIVNLALSQTRYGQEVPSAMDREGPYWAAVQAWFGPFRHHPLIESLDDLPVDLTSYYGFRNQGAAWAWTGTELVPGGVYPPGDARMLGGRDVLSDRIELVETFALDADVEGFFAAHGHHRDAMLARYRDTVPLRDMWDWLEARFPASTDGRDALVVRTSLLIGRSHNASTARLETHDLGRFVEGSMVSPAGGAGPVAPEEAGPLARTVFTEIDHHYVNPVSERHRESIARALDGRLDRFNQQETRHYATALATFNEYVTWVLFDVYWDDWCDRTGASDAVRAAGHRDTSAVMARRRFVAYDAFREAALPLVAHGPVEDAYPALVNWFAAEAVAAR